MKRDSILVSLFLSISTCWPVMICECRWANCNNETTFPYGGAYSTNLKRVVDDLVVNKSDIPHFSTSSHGQSPNTVYGLLQCVGNISAEKCSDCLKNAYKTVSDYCGNDIGGQVWMDDCFLRYDKFDFFKNLDIAGFSFPNESRITNSKAYGDAVTSLLQNLSEKAYDPTNKDFAIGSTTYAGSGKIYGLVQCWRTLESDDCKKCLLYARQEAQNCCSVNKGAQVLSTSCKIRFEIYPFFGSTESMLPLESKNPPTSSPPATHTEAHSSGKSSALPIVLGLVGALILVLVICLFLMRKRVASAISGGQIALVTQNEETTRRLSEARLIMEERHFVFSLEELAESTQNFNESNKLGVGGFGAVYKGTTRDGKEIAVKKLSARSMQGTREFMNEVKLLANVQHRNLVKLLGCCAQGDERLLVYEYFPNKSLDTFLFVPEKRRELSWEKRYKIILGIARGLLYLHEDSQLKIIHRDIKANNILLDEKLNAKIADFGLARLFGGDETHVNTKAAGTYGYMAPEYAMQGQLSVKADVYSFGVLLLEIMSGWKNNDVNIPYEMENLLEWAWRLYKGDEVKDMVDATVAETCPREKAWRFIQVGLLCVQVDASLRPTMSNVIVMISSNSVSLRNPQRPAFISMTKSHGPKARGKLSSGSGVDSYEAGTSGTMTSSSSAIASVNEASITQVNPR